MAAAVLGSAAPAMAAAVLGLASHECVDGLGGTAASAAAASAAAATEVCGALAALAISRDNALFALQFAVLQHGEAASCISPIEF